MVNKKNNLWYRVTLKGYIPNVVRQLLIKKMFDPGVGQLNNNIFCITKAKNL